MKYALFGYLLLFQLLQPCYALLTYKSFIWDRLLFSHEVNRTITVKLNSNMYFVCTNVATVVEKRGYDMQTSNMFENIWLVQNETYYENCRIDDEPGHGTDVFECNDATSLVFLKLLFLEYAAGKNDRTFEGGRYYYLISTSGGHKLYK